MAVSQAQRIVTWRKTSQRWPEAQKERKRTAADLGCFFQKSFKRFRFIRLDNTHTLRNQCSPNLLRVSKCQTVGQTVTCDRIKRIDPYLLPADLCQTRHPCQRFQAVKLGLDNRSRKRRGQAKNVANFAYLSFSFGFGGALVSDGSLLLDGFGNAGEFSGMYNAEESERRPALQFLLATLKKRDVPVQTIRQLCMDFDPNWPGVAEWVDITVPAYNRLVNALCAIADPQAIVFGGQIPARLAQMLIERTEFYQRDLPRYGVEQRRAKA